MMILSISPPVKAVGEGQWITTYKIEDSIRTTFGSI